MLLDVSSTLSVDGGVTLGVLSSVFVDGGVLLDDELLPVLVDGLVLLDDELLPVLVDGLVLLDDELLDTVELLDSSFVDEETVLLGVTVELDAGELGWLVDVEVLN